MALRRVSARVGAIPRLRRRKKGRSARRKKFGAVF
jgi:hypothetical protein